MIIIGDSHKRGENKMTKNNIEINYNNLWEDRENIVSALEVEGWKCK